MRICLAIAFVVAAGSAAHADDVADVRPFTAAVAAHDAKAVARLFGDHVSFNGMWFADRACAAKFSEPRVVAGAELADLARCVAKIELTAGARRTTVAPVLVEKPGIEIIVEMMAGKIALIGFVVPGATPTIAPAILERDRTAGSPRLAAPAGTWAAVCIDDHGLALGSTNVDFTSVDVDSAKAIANWRFRPFKLGGKATFVTMVVWTGPAPAPNLPARLLARPCDNFGENGVEGGVEGGVVGGVMDAPPPPPPPPPPPAPPQVVPPAALESQRIAGDKLITPSDDTKKKIAASGKSRIVASFKLCLDVTGVVSSVNALKSSGFADYDAKITTEMRKWRYRPFQVNGKAVPVCTAVTFIYSQTDPEPPKP